MDHKFVITGTGSVECKRCRKDSTEAAATCPAPYRVTLKK